jgi:hypothetical protein
MRKIVTLMVAVGLLGLIGCTQPKATSATRRTPPPDTTPDPTLNTKPADKTPITPPKLDPPKTDPKIEPPKSDPPKVESNTTPPK